MTFSNLGITVKSTALTDEQVGQLMVLFEEAAGKLHNRVQLYLEE